MSTVAPETLDMTTWLASLDEADGHVACCVAEPPRFICGAPYHPEAEADEQPEDVNCKTCVKLVEGFVCHRGHDHCPLQPMQPPCPGDKRQRSNRGDAG